MIFNKIIDEDLNQIIAENNIDGIEYKGYEPQFEAIAKAKVVLKGQTFYRYEADVRSKEFVL